MTPKQLWTGVLGIAVVAVILAITGLLAYLLYGPGLAIEIPSWFKTATSTLGSPLAGVSGTLFECSEEKALKAEFLSGSVNLALSDGRQIRLPETMAASGTRYANTNENFVFWTDEGRAFVEESGTVTYQDCLIRVQ